LNPFVRLYGRFDGYSSLATVTHGWWDALSEAGIVAGCGVSSEKHDLSRFPSGGQDAPVAIVGDVRLLPLAGAFHHRNLYVILATHTCWMPDEMLDTLRHFKAEVLAPSAIVAGQIQSIAPDVPVHLVPHGVSAAFLPISADQRASLPASELYKRLRGPGMAILHMAEGSTDRKGTYPLLEAFSDCLRRGMNASLTIVSSGIERMRIAMRATSDSSLNLRVRVMPRMDSPPDKLRWVYSCFDAVVQPSRAEGFGLVPLEALCCGTPVVVTMDCGHQEWADPHPNIKGQGLPGEVDIETGEQGPTEFDPAPAPTVTASMVADGLEHAYENRVRLKAEAEQIASSMAREWSWLKVTRPFLSHLERKFS
jgi:hypothetical protein